MAVGFSAQFEGEVAADAAEMTIFKRLNKIADVFFANLRETRLPIKGDSKGPHPAFQLHIHFRLIYSSSEIHTEYVRSIGNLCARASFSLCGIKIGTGSVA